MRRLVPGALLVGCAGLVWQRVFPLGALLPVLAVATVVPTGLVALWARRLSLWFGIVLSAGAWLLAAILVLRLADPLPGLRESWYDLLGTVLPAPAEPRYLVGVHALVWLAAYATAELLARTRTVAPALLPGFAVLLLGLVYGAGGPGSAVPAAGGYLLCALALLARRLRALPAVIGVVALALVLGPLATPGRQPFDPRHALRPASLPRTEVNPLDQVSSWLGAPDVALFTVAAPEPENWRIAVLDRFDGQTWRTDDPFLATGARVPVVAGTGAPLTQVVTISGLSGPWLPAAASPVSVAGIGVLADPVTGVLLSREPVHDTLRYQVTSRVSRFTPDEVGRAAPATDPAARKALELPAGLPDVVRQAADSATIGASSPFQQASGLEAYLRSLARNDPGAAPGHAYGHLAYFLAVSHRGSSEQFATAFAVMARTLGLPSRVVVGFRPGSRDGAGRWRVRGADALVWPELDFAGLGWVPFFPTPSASAPAGADVPAEGQSPQRQELDRAAAAPKPAPPQASTVVAPRPRPRTPWIAVAAPIAVGYFGVVLLVPAGRRYRRRRRTGPGARVVAAWREALVHLRWLGVTEVRTRTTREIAALGSARLGPAAQPALNRLAALADLAAFADRAVPPGAGDEAWRHRDALALLVRRRTGHWRTLRRRLSPRALCG